MTKVTNYKKEVEIVRVFNAPRELLFDVWTDPKHLVEWWGPHGFTVSLYKVDLRPGGEIMIKMRSPNGIIMPVSGRYKEIVKPERIVFTSSALDEDGKPLFETTNTLVLTEEEGRTKLTLHAGVNKLRPEGKRHIDGMKEGWTQTIERLEEYLMKI